MDAEKYISKILQQTSERGSKFQTAGLPKMMWIFIYGVHVYIENIHSLMYISADSCIFVYLERLLELTTENYGC